MRAVQWLAYTAFVLLPGVARADLFTFNATTDPITGTYMPVGSGHYNVPGAGENFGSFNVGSGIEGLTLYFSQGIFPADSSVSCDHHTGVPGTCFNGADFFLASDGSFVGRSFGLGMTFVIYNTSDQPLGAIYLLCSEDVLCSMNFVAGMNGSPVSAAALSAALGNDLTNANRIVATGGIQDAIDAKFYDGSADSFEFILSTPEPSTQPLLGAVLVGLGARILRRHRKRH